VTEPIGDLWPEDLVQPLPSSPYQILKTQALLLGGKTGHLVDADVRAVMDRDWVNLLFELVMPLLEGYRYKIFKVAYPAARLYPLDLYILNDPSKIEVASEADFIAKVSEILKEERVKTVIRSFMDMQRSPELAGIAG
jgi:hypothetical protein